MSVIWKGLIILGVVLLWIVVLALCNMAKGKHGENEMTNAAAPNKRSYLSK